MNWKNFFIAFSMITLALGLFGYIIFAGFVVPVFAECDSIGQYYQSSSINLSLGEWMFGNMIAAIIIFVLLGAMGKNNKYEQSECEMRFILVLLELYSLFEVVWSIIGFMVFGEGYKEACASFESFNDYITVVLYYGIILFPLIIITSISLAIIIIKEERESRAPVPHQQQDLNAPLNEPVPAQRSSNVYGRLVQRISASFQQNPNSIN